MPKHALNATRLAGGGCRLFHAQRGANRQPHGPSRRAGAEKLLARLFYGVYAAAFGWVVLNIAFTTTGNSPANMLLAAVFLLLLCLAVRYLLPKMDAWTPRRAARVAYFSLGAFALAQLTAGWLLMAIPVSDFAIVLDAADSLTATGSLGAHNGYLQMWPNNFGAVVLLWLWYKPLALLGIGPGQTGANVYEALALPQASPAGLYAGAVLNVLAMAGAICFTYKLARLLWKRQGPALLALFMCFFFAPYLLWVPYFYTDTLSMFFPVAGLYFYLSGRERAGRAAWLRLGACAALLLAGTLLKTSVLITAVAVGLHLLLTLPMKRALPRLGALAGVILVLWGGFTLATRGGRWYDGTGADEAQMPAWVWLMMASHGDGDACQCARCNAVRLTRPNAARAEAAREWMLESYGEYNETELLAFLTRKAVLTWGRGDYEALDYISAARQDNWTRAFLLPGQPLRAPLGFYCSAYNLMLLACLMAALLRRLRAGSFTAHSVLHLALFGVFLFFSFWETHSRYLLDYTPLLILAAAEGLLALEKRLPHRRRAPAAKA